MFDHSGVVHSRPYNIHQFPHTLLCILALLAFCKPKQVGYDPTIIYFSPHLSQNTGRSAIQVGSLIYDIIKQVFFNYLICGQGTLCWHVCCDGQDYIVKDLWTHESWVDHEKDILTKIRGLKGVPQLIATWTVQIGGKDDQTDTHHPIPTSSSICVHQQLLTLQAFFNVLWQNIIKI